MQSIPQAWTQSIQLRHSALLWWAFVEDSLNWTVVGEYFGHHPGGVRISVLEYGGESWYKVELMRETTIYDHKKGRIENVRGWMNYHIYEPTADGEVFGELVSITQIVGVIKEIDMGRR